MPIAKIDPELCQGCGKCVDTCPEDVIRLNLDPCAGDLRSPCAMGCPAGVSVRKYSYYVEMDMMEEAAQALAECLPFPAITGRICPHPCEAKCARAEVDQPVNINALERYVGDYILREGSEPVRPVRAGTVAVIGSGPAGLSCAYFLCRKGYAVTVFEALPVAGGMLRVGIPSYRLPKEIVADQICYMQDMGVEIRTGVTVGRDISLEELRREYSAVFFAGGLQSSRRAPVEGDQLDGVGYALEFLRRVGLGDVPEIRRRVAVIGGGSVAMDTAQTLSRMGAEEVHIFSLEKEGKMPAQPEEVRQAAEEGIRIHPGRSTKRILGEYGRVCGLEVVECVDTLDKAGRFAPQLNEDLLERYEVDQIIFAVGQAPEASLTPAELPTGRGGMVSVDPVTLETSLPGVFAGGDIAGKGGIVVKALASGREAAESIDRYLRGADLREGRGEHTRVQYPPKEGIPLFPRQEVELLPPEERKNSFREVKPALTENQARLEAQRCMTCGSRAEIRHAEDCMVCLYCERDCPAHAIYVSPDRVARRMGPWDLDG